MTRIKLPALSIQAVARGAAGIIAGLLLAGGSLPARADPPVWHIHQGGADITLFGSVHLLSPLTHWNTPALAADLAKADEVWFEIPFDAASKASEQQVVAKRATLPPGQTLSALLPEKTKARLAAAAKRLMIDPAALDRMQPWFAEVFISTTDLQRHGAQQGLGVEEQIDKTAPPEARRRAFETIEEQIGFFADPPMKDQVASLDETLKELLEKPDLFDKLVTAWSAGDAKAVDRLAVEALRHEEPAIYQRLVVARNRRWVTVIQDLLQRPRRVFIVVGVGHLIGPDSVPALLRRKGVRVEGP